MGVFFLTYYSLKSKIFHVLYTSNQMINIYDKLMLIFADL